ncbi:MAG: hypothetical protein K8S27_14810 [Candidatus Omnitrophica bacterium]|nr:hypothetical protein [Candidatus Omnitrophota bacterium]
MTTDQTNADNLRKNYFIKKEFQTLFIIKFCSIIIGAAILSSILIYFIYRNKALHAFKEFNTIDIHTFTGFIMPMTITMGLVVTAIASFFTIILSLYTSHKIAGPLYRMQKEIKKMKIKNFETKIALRTNDQLQDFCCDLEELRLLLNEAFCGIIKNWEALKPKLNHYIQQTKDKDAIESKSDLERILRDIRIDRTEPEKNIYIKPRWDDVVSID